MIINKGRNPHGTTVMSYCNSLFKMENLMRVILNKWETFEDGGYSDEIDACPWMTAESVFLSDIDVLVSEMFSAIEDIDRYYSDFGEDTHHGLVIRVTTYFERGAGAELQKIITYGAGCDESILSSHRILLEKMYRYILTILYEVFEIRDVVEKNEVPGYISNAIATIKSYDGTEIDYLTDLIRRHRNMPISVNYIVNDNIELIVSMLDSPSGKSIDRDMFFHYSDAVMPYDIVAMKNNDLVIDDNYVQTLINREENPFAIHHVTPQVYDIYDKIPAEYGIKMFKYENYISDKHIDQIRKGTKTVEAIIAEIEEECKSYAIEAETSEF